MSRLLPYETIVKAHEGDPEAVDAVLSHYTPTSQRGLRPMVSASPNFSGRRYGGRPYAP